MTGGPSWLFLSKAEGGFWTSASRAKRALECGGLPPLSPCAVTPARPGRNAAARQFARSGSGAAIKRRQGAALQRPPSAVEAATRNDAAVKETTGRFHSGTSRGMRPMISPAIRLVSGLLLFLLPAAVFAGAPAFVVNNNGQSITIIDIATRQVTGTIPVGNQPSELLILLDNRFALLTEYGDNRVRKIDLRVPGGIAEAPTGVGPGSITVSPGARTAYIANSTSNDISVVDVATMTLTATVPVGSTPIQVNRRPDGAFIYSVDQDMDQISVIDTATLAVTRVPTGSRPNQFAVHRAGQRAFIPTPGSDRVEVFDLASNTMVGPPIQLPAGSQPGIVQFSPDGNRMFVLNRGNGTVSIIENLTTTPVKRKDVTVGAQPTDIALTFDGQYAYVACFGSDQVYVLDLTHPTLALVDATPLSMGTGSQPFTLAFDGDENFVFVVLLGANKVAVLDTNTDREVARIDTGAGPVGFVQLHQPFVYPGGVANAASFAGAPVSGGAIISLFGEGLVAEEGTADSLPLPTSLKGTQVKFNGTAAPLFFTSGLQINAQAPVALLGQASATLEVTGPHGSDVSTVSLAAVSPGLFSLTSDGRGPGAIVHLDGAIVSAGQPARPGEIVLVFGAGFGATNPQIKEGEAAGGPAPITGSAVVHIGGQAVPPENVLYAGLSGEFAGLYQINLKVPDTLPAGTHNLTVTVNGVISNTVTLAVQEVPGSAGISARTFAHEQRSPRARCPRSQVHAVQD